MNVDNITKIGASHITCDDYSLSRVWDGEDNQKIALAMISDGCSASKDTDLGSRLLSIISKNIFKNVGVSFPTIKLLESYINRELVDIKTRLDIPYTCFDATLGVVYINNNIARILIWGDGAYAIKRGDELIYGGCISFPKNAPDYLSYNLDENRKKIYLQEHSEKQIECIHGTITQLKPFSPYYIEYNVYPGDVICVMSDGVCSYKDQQGNPISWNEILNKYVSFKNTNGEFIQRRINMMEKINGKEGILHIDDISLAGISL